ncbi:hypothetical protein ACOMHN_053790 [Nucella lapillus]
MSIGPTRDFRLLCEPPSSEVPGIITVKVAPNKETLLLRPAGCGRANTTDWCKAEQPAGTRSDRSADTGPVYHRIQLGRRLKALTPWTPGGRKRTSTPQVSSLR